MMLGRIWLLCRRFGWFKGVWGSLGEFVSSQGVIGLYLDSFWGFLGVWGVTAWLHAIVWRIWP